MKRVTDGVDAQTMTVKEVVFAVLSPVSRRSRKVIAHGKPQQNLKVYDYTAVLFGFLHIRSFGRIHLFVLRYTKMN